MSAQRASVLPEAIVQRRYQCRARLGMADLAQRRRGFFAYLPSGIAQGAHQRRQHDEVTGKPQSANRCATYLGVGLMLGQSRQGGQRGLVLEPTENPHRFAAHQRILVLQCPQRRLGCVFQAQFAQGAQGTGADKGIGMGGPRQNQLPGFRGL